MSFGNEEKLNKNLSIVMNKKLAEGRYLMTLNERRLMYVALSKLTPYDRAFSQISFSKTEYIALLNECGISVDTSVFEKDLKMACNELLTRVVWIDTETDWTAFQWLSEAHYDYETQIVSLKFHEKMKPFLLYMLENKGYSKFLLKFALPLTSAYSARFYEFFKAKVSTSQPIAKTKLTIEEIRTMLMLEENKYGRYNDLKRWVIKQATKEINNKTDLSISFRENKSRHKGRRVESLTFLIELKQNCFPTAWDKYKIYSEEDLDALIKEFIRRYSGQKIEIANDTPNSELRKNAKARVFFELKNNFHRLDKIKYLEGFVRYLIEQYSQDEVMLNQTSIEEYLSQPIATPKQKEK